MDQPEQYPPETGIVPPTQTVYPWRATVRTVVAALVALASLLPVIATVGDLGAVPGVTQVVAVAGVVTRILAIPGVDAWLRRFVPWLAAQPAADQ
jgi:hypothetical protein